MENFPQEERKGFVRDTMRKLSIHMPKLANDEVRGGC